MNFKNVWACYLMGSPEDKQVSDPLEPLRFPDLEKHFNFPVDFFPHLSEFRTCLFFSKENLWIRFAWCSLKHCLNLLSHRNYKICKNINAICLCFKSAPFSYYINSFPDSVFFSYGRLTSGYLSHALAKLLSTMLFSNYQRHFRKQNWHTSNYVQK